MSSCAFYAGSFDPVTVGHVDLVMRSLSLFDEVVVGVGTNVAKRGWFTAAQRQELFAASLPATSAVRFVAFEGLAVHAAKRAGATVLLRGLRGPSDLDLEQRNAAGNRDLSGLETLWLLASPVHSYVSSSLVREIAAHGGDVARYVPAAVLPAIARYLQAQQSV